MSLPHSYPYHLPEISVYSSKLNRPEHDCISNNLKIFLNTVEPGTLCITSAIEWIIENFSPLGIEKTNVSTLFSENQRKHNRLWIQSHHIYSKTKIKNIEDWAKELNLTGFVLAGKPGFICVEGLEENCQMWWQRV